MTEIVRLAPAIRLLPPGSLNDPSWRALNLYTNKEYRLGRHSAALCVACSAPVDAEQAIDTVAQRSQADVGRLRDNLRILVQDDVLVSGAEPTWLDELFSQWRAFGWAEAADHHVASFDYPFFDYSRDGWTKDAELMATYRASEADLLRAKPAYPGPSISTGSAEECLAVLDLPLERALSGQRSPARAVGRADLETLAAATFGVYRQVRRRSENAAPTLRKTSPSGGARHPTEAYFLVQNVAGLAPGVYHFHAVAGTLTKIGEIPDEASVRSIFFGPFRARFPVAAVVVLTSQFERNMYRYREPRTFRTVILDVGHLTATFDLAARSLGLRTYAQHGFDDDAVQALLELDPFVEGAIYAVAVGSAPDSDADADGG